jgi:hypothetical protein
MHRFKLPLTIIGSLFAIAFGMMPVAASADPCNPSWEFPVPNCERQVQPPLLFNPSTGAGWAFYCTGDHPYYWSWENSSHSYDYTFDNSCFTMAENSFYEGQPNKFDATIVNWCLESEQIVVTLGCSTDPPPDYIPGCPGGTVGNPVGDPGCPQSNDRTFCFNARGVPVCFQLYTETCSSGPTYFCTNDSGLAWCNQCQQQ